MKHWLRLMVVICLLLCAGLEGYGQVPMERVYADDVQKSNDEYLLVIRAGYVENENNATDGNPQTAATLNSTTVSVPLVGVIGGEATIRLRFTGTDKPTSGTPVTVKLGLGGAVLNILSGLTVQAVNGSQTANNGSGNEVGPVHEFSNLLGLLAGENQIEFTFTPTVPYDGVKIKLGAPKGALSAGVLSTAKVTHAYFFQPPTGPVACDQSFDLLYGATGSIAGIVNPVVDPYNSIDGNEETYAVLNANASALDNRTHLTALFPYVAPAGDSIRLLLQDPGGLLNLGLLSEKLYVRTFNGTSDNGYLELDQNLLRLRLLVGSADIYEITYPVAQPFDRIQVAVGGGLASALESLNIYEIGRLAVGPTIADVTGGIYTVCYGDIINLSISSPQTGYSYKWYDSTGASVGNGDTFNPGALGAGDHIYYITATRPECTTESGRTMVVVKVNRSAVAADIDVDANSPFCLEDDVVLTPSSTTVTDPVFKWYHDAAKTQPIISGTEGTIIYQIAGDGTLTIQGLEAGQYDYYVSVSNSATCENTAGFLQEVTVEVHEPPSAPTIQLTPE